MASSVKSAAEYSIPELADLISRAFTGYIAGSIHLDSIGFLTLMNRENIDLALSRVFVHEDKPVGIGLLVRQGWTTRLAAMGIVPEAQEHKLGTAFMQQLIEEAQQRGDHTMLLEAFEQNIRAVRLYQRMGFIIVRRLFGYTAGASAGTPHPDLREVDIFDVAKQILLSEIVPHDYPDLPWQLSGTAASRWSLPNRAFQLGEAWAVISDPAQAKLVLRALIVPLSHRRQGHATRLLEALRARYPDKSWVISPLCPEEFGSGYLERHGFTRNALHQVQMALPLVKI